VFRFNKCIVAIVGWTLFAFGSATSASAQVVFNASMCGPIAADDTQFDGQDIIVDGCALSIAGSHDFASLTLRNRAQLTHPPAGDVTAAPYPQIPEIGLDLEIAGNMTIAALTSINLDGKGFGPGAGPGAGRPGTTNTNPPVPSGGGGNGGNGGGVENGGTAYGTFQGPIDAGSGGGGDALAGIGGGALRLNVQGTLTIAGSITANGTQGTIGGNRGGGSGGSIWIMAGTMAGGGSITAIGGQGRSQSTAFGGGGAGGRIAMSATTSTFTGTIRANGVRGPNGNRAGGAGTSFTRLGASPTRLVLDNFGLSNALDSKLDTASTDFSGDLVFDGNLVVARGARLSHPRGEPLNLRVTGDMTIDATSAFDVSGRGFPAGTGDSRPVGSGGAGYGGTGGGIGGGAGYGSIENPTGFGSGAGIGGGTGGGFAQLTVDGTLSLDGLIGSNGFAGSGSGSSGGGSGGSVLVRATTLTGGGLLRASGGAGRGEGGGGSGGRIAVYSGSSSFSGATEACGEGSINDGRIRGGAGTVWQRDDSQPLAKLTIDNCDQANGATTEIVGSRRFESDLYVGGFAKLSHPPMTKSFLTFAGNATIAPTGSFDVSGRGFAPGDNPGPGAGLGRAGGGYGGAGGTYLPTDIGGLPYGVPLAPLDFGSAGSTGVGAGPNSAAGAGGGVVRLIVEGLLQVDGSIVSDGTRGVGQYSGGGSGGSVYLTAGRIAGTGALSARGGNAANLAAGGGGGRIRITSCMPTDFAATAREIVATPGSQQTSLLGMFGQPSTPIIGFGSPDENDMDCDDVVDAQDNCPFFPNADQADSGGIANPFDLQGTAPDDIGDACQCGDSNGDGRVTAADATVLTRCLGNLDTCVGDTGLSGLPGGLAKCGVDRNAGCDALDATLIGQAVLGLASLQQACSAALAPISSSATAR
jgi:hypothetical protein